MKSRIISAFVLLALSLLVVQTAGAASFKIIVNSSVRVQTLPAKTVSELFMKRATKWDGGAPVVPVDQVERSETRDSFSHAVHGKPAAAVRSYWNQQIFSGRDVPPIEKENDAEVLAFVRSTAGAVGYVSEAAPTDGVRVIQVQ